MFKKGSLQDLLSAHEAISNYYVNLRSFFEILDLRFSIPEYGVRLARTPSDRLFTNASYYQLADNSAYPFYLWQPTWLGCSYVEHPGDEHGGELDRSAFSNGKPGLMAFVWTWLGLHDAYVADTQAPECWFGVARMTCDRGDASVSDVAETLWKFFRVERTSESESGGWTEGRFSQNAAGGDLHGDWQLRRVPLDVLTSYYAVEGEVVEPLATKYHEWAVRS